MNSHGLMIAAPASGSGKTTITCGILKVLKRKGLNVVSFKCGPDFIDPLFHERVLGIPSRNLDLFLAGEDAVKRTYFSASCGRDISVTEGVMGYYDGICADSSEASSYEIANVLKIPVVLVINSRGKALSAIAELYGFLKYRQNSRIAGVIFNQMSEGVFESLKEKVRKLGVIPLGYLPKNSDFIVESRHLGLKTPSDIEDIEKKLNLLADTVEKTIDFDALISLADSAKEAECASEVMCDEYFDVKIAVAKDDAFCFLYHANIDVIESFGAKIQYFSPLTDTHIPDDVKGIILPGGYPELYAKQLSENESMLLSVKKKIQEGIPTLAECGGFLYLHSELEGMDGKFYAMCKVLKNRAYRTDKLRRFGYITLCADCENPYLAEGETVRAHEFHYYDSEEAMQACTAKKPKTEKSWRCMVSEGNLFAGFPHIYYESDKEFIKRFLTRCAER